MKFLAFFTYVVAVAAAFRSVHRTRGVVVTSRKVAGIQPPKTNDYDEKDGREHRQEPERAQVPQGARLSSFLLTLKKTNI